MRKEFIIVSIVTFALVGALSLFFTPILWVLVPILPIFLMGMQDVLQKTHSIRRNFPVLGRFRYWLEAIRPEINQYFIENNSDGVPFSREQRSIVYQRAKKTLDTLPFGTQLNVYAPGYEWINHSFMPKHVDPSSLRVMVGGPHCKKPYSLSLLNISALSYGALSKNAILALNGGALDGGFAHNTGEGSISPYHLEPGGDLIWQIGTGYFGCRTEDGRFSDEKFKENALLPNIKMIEIKISQGAKPGHGGILPAKKVTKEISKIRGVPMGRDVLSPPAHTAFSTPLELIEFIRKLRTLSGGKPVGMKLCLGKRREFIAVCKAMHETGDGPDYIAIDGGEGGTGAAPLEFSNYVGAPGLDSLSFVHNALKGYRLRNRVTLLASGKITTGFGIIQRLALGADACYSARAMMLALGCIQALRCNANVCPTGVATQDPSLYKGLVVPDKRKRVRSFHEETIKSAAEMIGAMGLISSKEVRPWHIFRRINTVESKHYGELFDQLIGGELIDGNPPPSFARANRAASAKTFASLDIAQS